MAKKPNSGYLVGSMEMIDKMSEANRQIKSGLISEYPEDESIIFNYYREMAESLSRLRVRLKKKSK